MSEQLELGILKAPSSCAEDSPARISRQPEAVPGWLGSAQVFGGNMLGSFAQFCPDSLSLRTFQLSLGGGFLPFSGTLPRAGMMRNGMLSERRPSGRAIDVTGCSLLLGETMPTPTAAKGGNVSRGGKRRGEKLLAGAARDLAARMLPTPTAGDARGSESRNTKTSKAHYGLSLTDWSRQDDGRGRGSSSTRGKLSVRFVRWMMGFPAGWLCSEP